MSKDLVIPLMSGVLLCSLGLILLGFYYRSKPKTLHQRLQGKTAQESLHEEVESLHHGDFSQQSTRVARWLLPFEKIGLELAGTQSDRFAARRLLSMAGFRRQSALGLFTFSKYAIGVVAILLYLFVGLEPGGRMSLNGLAGSLMLLFCSSFLTELWLKSRGASRGGRLSSSLPDALDLMVICAEAGLPLGRIFKTVSTELAFSAPEIAQELGYTYSELQILGDRSKALLNLSQRCGVENIEAMVSTLIQAERYGTPLSQALRTISEESRKRLVLELEEKAGKLPAQLSVPLMAFILPPVIAMMGTPAMIRIIRMLGS